MPRKVITSLAAVFLMSMQAYVETLQTDQKLAEVYEFILGYGFGSITLASVLFILVHWRLVSKT